MSKVFVIIGVVLTLGLFACSSPPTPEQVAKDWVESNVDKTSEEVVSLIVGDNILLREIGGEIIESKVNDTVKWNYNAVSSMEVVATASVSFDLETSLVSGSVGANVPFVLMIDGDKVTDWRVDVTGALVDTTLSNLQTLDVSGLKNKLFGN